MLVPLRRQTLGREDIGRHTPEASSGRRKARPRQFLAREQVPGWGDDLVVDRGY
jgi:hypothetical protein